MKTKLTAQTCDVLKSMAMTLSKGSSGQDRPSIMIPKGNDNGTYIQTKSSNSGIWYNAPELFNDELFIIDALTFVNTLNFHDEPTVDVVNRAMKFGNSTADIEFIRIASGKSYTDIAQMNESSREHLNIPKITAVDLYKSLGTPLVELTFSEETMSEIKKLSSILGCQHVTFLVESGKLVVRINNAGESTDKMHDITFDIGDDKEDGDILTIRVTDLTSLFDGEYAVSIFETEMRNLLMLKLNDDNIDLTYSIQEIDILGK